MNYFKGDFVAGRESSLLQESSTLVDLLQLRAETSPDLQVYTFLVEGEREAGALSAAHLDRRARALAAALQETAETGDRALLLFPPGTDRGSPE